MYKVIKIAGVCLLAVFLLALSVSLLIQAADALPAKAAVVTAMNVEQGVIIAAVQPNSLAAKAGLAQGDIVLKVNDTEVNKLEEFDAALIKVKTGDTIRLTVLRGNETREVQFVLNEQSNFPWLGIIPDLKSLPKPELSSAYSKAPNIEGVTPDGLKVVAPLLVAEVLNVTKDSPAATADLRKGDRIVRVDAQSLSLESQFAAKIGTYKPGNTIVLTVRRAGTENETVDLSVTLGKNPQNETAAYLGIRYALLSIIGDGAQTGDRLPSLPQGAPPRPSDLSGMEKPRIALPSGLPPSLPGLAGPPKFGSMEKSQGETLTQPSFAPPSEILTLEIGDL